MKRRPVKREFEPLNFAPKNLHFDFSPFLAVPPSGPSAAPVVEPPDDAAVAGDPLAEDCRLETVRGERADNEYGESRVILAMR